MSHRSIGSSSGLTAISLLFLIGIGLGFLVLRKCAAPKRAVAEVCDERIMGSKRSSCFGLDRASCLKLVEGATKVCREEKKAKDLQACVLSSIAEIYGSYTDAGDSVCEKIFRPYMPKRTALDRQLRKYALELTQRLKKECDEQVIRSCKELGKLLLSDLNDDHLDGRSSDEMLSDAGGAFQRACNTGDGGGCVGYGHVLTRQGHQKGGEKLLNENCEKLTPPDWNPLLIGITPLMVDQCNRLGFSHIPPRRWYH